MRLPSSKKRSHEVLCMGGPWAGKLAWFPVQHKDDPLSLPIRVGEFTGRYDLNTGIWYGQ